MTFTGGTGPLNRKVKALEALGWILFSLTRESANRWEIILRCGGV